METPQTAPIFICNEFNHHFCSLSQELANLRVSEFTSSSIFLNKFDSKLEQFNKLSPNGPLPENMVSGFFLTESRGNSKLRNAWATKRTICQSATPATVPTYAECFDYLMFPSKQLETSVVNNTSIRKANSLETDYLSRNSPSDPDYHQATDLFVYMGVQDADFAQYTLECNKSMNEEKSWPEQKTRRKPVREDLKIREAWGEMDKEHKQAWIRAKDSTKEKMIDQWKSQLSGPVTKNQQLRTDGRTVYKLDFEDYNGDEYYSDYTANSEATYDFNVHSSVYKTTSYNNSNGESVLEGKELNVSATAAATNAKPTSILREKIPKRKNLYRSSEMPAGAVSKMLASKQLKLRDPKTNELISYMTYAAKMAVMDYSQCDSLLPIPIKQPPPIDLHYKVNLLHQHEIEYRANMSKQDRVVVGRHLALVDGGANGGIIGRNMRIIYFNANGK